MPLDELELHWSLSLLRLLRKDCVRKWHLNLPAWFVWLYLALWFTVKMLLVAVVFSGLYLKPSLNNWSWFSFDAARSRSVLFTLLSKLKSLVMLFNNPRVKLLKVVCLSCYFFGNFGRVYCVVLNWRFRLFCQSCSNSNRSPPTPWLISCFRMREFLLLNLVLFY